MNRVLTQDEVHEVKEKRQKVREVKETPAPDVKPKERYYLFHPELNDDFEDEIELDGEKHKRKCKDNIVTVESEKIKNYLVSKGFIFLRSEKT